MFTLIDYEIVNAPISAMVYLVSSLFLFWVSSLFLFWVFFKDGRFYYFFLFFSSQLTLKALAGSKPRNKIYNQKVRNPS